MSDDSGGEVKMSTPQSAVRATASPPPTPAQAPSDRRKTSGHFVPSAGIDFGVTRDDFVRAAVATGTPRTEAEAIADQDLL